jgi:hypothetical protein
MQRLFAAFSLAALLLGCPPPAQPMDAGVDAGKPDAGVDAGVDAGPTNDDLCDFGGPRLCPAGSACTISRLSDGGSAKRCAPGACDVVDQDCDGGLKCAFADGGRACVPDGVLNECQSCDGAPVGCRAGLACTFVGADGGSACARFCRVNGDCGAPQQCYVTLVLPDSDERPLVCADPPPSCDLLAQNCASASDGCYPNGTMANCFAAGTVAAGASCRFSNECVKGSVCSGTSPACRQLCQFPSGAPACTTGTCTRLQNFSDAGVCL